MSIDHSQKYIFSVHNVLSANECREMIDRIESAGMHAAPVITSTGTRVKSRVRNNERVIFDDEELASTLYERVKEYVPESVHDMSVCGVNERIRCYRYKPGMRFAPHIDAPFVRNDSEMSFYTFLIYLNDDYEGGQTTFIVKPEVVITPDTGMGLFFQHPLIHEGSLVTKGVKYALRTDVMYCGDTCE